MQAQLINRSYADQPGRRADSIPTSCCICINSSRHATQMLRDWQNGISSAITSMSANCAIPVPPPLPEQRAIAGALSDVDALIGALDRLIAKKRDLKQAAMQQLLTGQTRLPGFHGEWEVKRLGEIVGIASTASRQDSDEAHVHRRTVTIRVHRVATDCSDYHETVHRHLTTTSSMRCTRTVAIRDARTNASAQFVSHDDDAAR